MASTGTTPAELLIDINSTIRTQTGANTITPTTHSDLLDNIVKVLSGGTEYTDTFFVMKNGDDSTGTINDISKPYSTILSAKTAAEIAMSGDPSIRSLIYVFNGSYSGESSLMYNGAYYFEANTYVETASLTESLSKALFYAGGPDRDETPTYNKTCKVFGHAHFHAVPCSDEGTTSNPWNNGIITINDSGSTLEMNCDKLTATAGGRQVAVGGGTLKLVCDSMEFGSTYSAATGNYANFDGVALYSGTLDIDCNTLVTNYPYSSSIHSVGIYQGTNYGLLSRININHIKSTARLNDFSSSYHSSSIFFYQTGLGGYDANVTLDVNTINSNGWSVHSLDVRSGNLSVNVNRAESEQGVFLWNRVNEVSLDTSMSIKGHYVTISGDTSQTAAYIYNRNSNSNYYLDGVFENKGTSKAVEINDTNAERILMNGAFYSQTGTTVNISAIGNPLVMENVYLYNELGTYNIESTSAEIVNSLGTLYLDSQVDSNTTINGLYSTLNTVYTPALNINSIGSGTSVTNLGIDSSGNVVSGSTGGGAASKRYVALITQIGTNPPTAKVLQNDLGLGAWSYDVQGDYILTINGAFTLDKTSILLGSIYDAGDRSTFGSSRLDNDRIRIASADNTGAPSNDIFLDTTLVIEVFTP